ncbi:MAG: hypothetical protein LBV21_01130, partial [Candidatus Adiutrix sp.]|nr:hypothetical protein [Candidatus Adiutrix sp.]
KLRLTNEYETGRRGFLVAEELAVRGRTLAAAAALGRRNEQAHVDAMEDLWWKRREQVVNRGRNMAASSVRYGDLASGILGDLTRQAAAGAGGGIYALAYDWNRNPTYYPTYREAYRQPAGLAGSDVGVADPLPVSSKR